MNETLTNSLEEHRICTIGKCNANPQVKYILRSLFIPIEMVITQQSNRYVDFLEHNISLKLGYVFKIAKIYLWTKNYDHLIL